MNTWTPLWLGWGALFAVLEGTALWAHHTGRLQGNGTLSALVWRFIAWKSGAGHRVARGVFAVGWLVLTSHFFLHLP